MTHVRVPWACPEKIEGDSETTDVLKPSNMCIDSKVTLFVPTGRQRLEVSTYKHTHVLCLYQVCGLGYLFNISVPLLPVCEVGWHT